MVKIRLMGFGIGCPDTHKMPKLHYRKCWNDEVWVARTVYTAVAYCWVKVWIYFGALEPERENRYVAAVIAVTLVLKCCCGIVSGWHWLAACGCSWCNMMTRHLALTITLILLLLVVPLILSVGVPDNFGKHSFSLLFCPFSATWIIITAIVL